MDELGKNFWWKAIGFIVVFGILGLLAWVLFTGLLYRFGALAVLIVLFGILLIWAYRHDKQEQRRFEED